VKESNDPEASVDECPALSDTEYDLAVVPSFTFVLFHD